MTGKKEFPSGGGSRVFGGKKNFPEKKKSRKNSQRLGCLRGGREKTPRGDSGVPP